MKRKSKVDKYLIKQSNILNASIEDIKESLSDSDVKGGKNENILYQFLLNNYHAHDIKTNSEIIDSFGNYSSEVDIVISNEYQPFKSHPLIAEGVDIVIQVKGTITTSEISRIISNCKSVKKLTRRFHDTDRYVISDFTDYEAYITRIPYVVFAFSSQVTIEYLTKKFCEKQEDGIQDSNLFPDAIFILDRGMLINFRINFNHPFQPIDKKTHGFAGFPTRKRTLLEFIRFLHTSVSRHYKYYHPLNYYFEDYEEFRPYGRFLSNEQVDEILNELEEE